MQACAARQPSLRSTPAMALGIFDGVWVIGDRLEAAPAELSPDLGRRHKKPTLAVIAGDQASSVKSCACLSLATTTRQLSIGSRPATALGIGRRSRLRSVRTTSGVIDSGN